MPVLLFVFSLLLLSSGAGAKPVLYNAIDPGATVGSATSVKPPRPGVPAAIASDVIWASCVSLAPLTNGHQGPAPGFARKTVMAVGAMPGSLLDEQPTPLVDRTKGRILSGAARALDPFGVDSSSHKDSVLILASAGLSTVFFEKLVTKRNALNTQISRGVPSRFETGVIADRQARRAALADRFEVLLLVLGTWLVVLLTWNWRRYRAAGV